MTSPKTPGGRGGRREGAGRPHTYRRVTLDEESAQQLGELLANRRQKYPEAHWNASKLLSYLVTGAWIHEIHDQQSS